MSVFAITCVYTQERVDGITSRLAFELRSVSGIELGAYQAYVEAAVNGMLQVRYNYN